MKLIGNLKKQVEETKNKEEAKEVIEKAGMELTDDELDQVAGGRSGAGTLGFEKLYCDRCGKEGPRNRSCGCGGIFSLSREDWIKKFQ